MIEITQLNDKKEKHQSFECTIVMNNEYSYSFWYWENTKESVEDFKEWIEKWKAKLDKAFESINYEELHRFDWEEKRTLIFD